MPFEQAYPIIPRYLTSGTKRRSGLPMAEVKFIVAHDTGNSGSTASGNVAYYQNSVNAVYQSAHIFVDDKEIIECIPVTTGTPEKAWHVRYDAPEDNDRFGAESNDAAIGVEYCYGGAIHAAESYARFVWTLAYLCYLFHFPPERSIVGHFILDPSRRTDPKTGLAASGRTYEQLLVDVVTEYRTRTGTRISPYMKLIKNTTSNKVYAIGKDNKKHWIINEETFVVGREMGLWGGDSDIEVQNDDAYAVGHTVILVK